MRGGERRISASGPVGRRVAVAMVAMVMMMAVLAVLAGLAVLAVLAPAAEVAVAISYFRRQRQQRFFVCVFVREGHLSVSTRKNEGIGGIKGLGTGRQAPRP